MLGLRSPRSDRGQMSAMMISGKGNCPSERGANVLYSIHFGTHEWVLIGRQCKSTRGR